MRKRIRRILRRSGYKLGSLWRWFKRADGLRSAYRRAKALRNFARDRSQRFANLRAWHNDRVQELKEHPWHDRNKWQAELARQRKLRERNARKFEKWHNVRLVYRRRARKLRKKLKKRNTPADSGDFQTWMLNGHSGNISEGTKRLTAYVVSQGGVVTDTYDYSGHTPSSKHYPRNNPDGKGHAIDYVPASCNLQTNCKQRFGVGFFNELFGPCFWYIKTGGEVWNGAPFPGHSDHEHGAPFS